jgi:hypothetical protein
MAWVELTVAKFKMRFSAGEVESVLSEQGDTNAIDAAITEYLTQAANDTVSRVNKCRRSRGLAAVSPPARYVPPGSERHAYTLAQFMSGINLPSLTALQGENRKSAYDRAEDYLGDLAACEVDMDDEGAADFETGTGTSAPAFGGYQKMDFVGTAGVNEPLFTSTTETE